MPVISEARVGGMTLLQIGDEAEAWAATQVVSCDGVAVGPLQLRKTATQAYKGKLSCYMKCIICKKGTCSFNVKGLYDPTVMPGVFTLQASGQHGTAREAQKPRGWTAKRMRESTEIEEWLRRGIPSVLVKQMKADVRSWAQGKLLQRFVRWVSVYTKLPNPACHEGDSAHRGVLQFVCWRSSMRLVGADHEGPHNF